MTVAVLIVEDEPVLALGIARLLRLHGFDIAGCVGSVSKALAVINEVDCDIAVLDVNLRGETVMPVAELLRQRGRPFVFISGYDRADLKAIFSDATVFPKPFDAGELIAVLRQISQRPQNA